MDIKTAQEQKLQADFSAADMRAVTPFSIIRGAKNTVPFLFNAPHAGRCYARSFMAQTCLDKRSVRASEDCYTDMIFADAPALGATFMAAHFPRSYVDVNRPAFALEASMFSGLAKADAQWLQNSADSPYLRAGFGSVPRNAAPGRPLYKTRLPFTEATERLLSFYFPYHSALLAELLRLRAKFGEVFLLDCHSMPSLKTACRSEKEPDIVLGNCHGRSCEPLFFALARRLLEDMGYSVACNSPYAGGHITAHYGRPELNMQALQIELNRRLYLNPQNLQITKGFAALQKNMKFFAAQLIEAVSADSGFCAAAE